MQAIRKKDMGHCRRLYTGIRNRAEPEFTSREAPACLTPVTLMHMLKLYFFFEDRPVGPYYITVPARRTLHMRFNNLESPVQCLVV